MMKRGKFFLFLSVLTATSGLGLYVYACGVWGDSICETGRPGNRCLWSETKSGSDPNDRPNEDQMDLQCRQFGGNVGNCTWFGPSFGGTAGWVYFCCYDAGLEDDNPDDRYRCSSCVGSPILISQRQNRFQLTSAADGVYFDIDADGRTEKIAWTTADSDDLFLAFDWNNNGIIDSGKELFGDSSPQGPSDTPNGFAALQVWDSVWTGGNEDGAITEADAIYPHLLLWQDLNHDGISQGHELHPLDCEHFAVTEISLDYRESRRRDRYGNEFRYIAPATVAAPTKRGDMRARRRWAVDVFVVGEAG